VRNQCWASVNKLQETRSTGRKKRLGFGGGETNKRKVEPTARRDQMYTKGMTTGITIGGKAKKEGKHKREKLSMRGKNGPKKEKKNESKKGYSSFSRAQPTRDKIARPKKGRTQRRREVKLGKKAL